MSILSVFFFFFFFKAVDFWGLVELLSSSPIPCFHVGFKSIYCFGWRKPKKKKKADMKIHLYSLLMEAVNVWCRWDLKHTERLMPRCSRGEIKTAHLKNLHILQIYRNRGVKEPRETGFFVFFSPTQRQRAERVDVLIARCCCFVRGVDLWPGATCAEFLFNQPCRPVSALAWDAGGYSDLAVGAM